MSTRKGFLGRALAGVVGVGTLGLVELEAAGAQPIDVGMPVGSGYHRGVMLARMASRAPASIEELEAAHLLGASRSGFEFGMSHLLDQSPGLRNVTTVTGALDKETGERRVPVLPVLILHAEGPQGLERVMVLEGPLIGVDFDASGARHVSAVPSVLMRWAAQGSMRYLSFHEEASRLAMMHAGEQIRSGSQVPFFGGLYRG